MTNTAFDLPAQPPQPDLGTFGARLIYVRFVNHLTGRGMAARLGMSPSRYDRYEKGDQDKDCLTIALAVEALMGVPHQWLLEGSTDGGTMGSVQLPESNNTDGSAGTHRYLDSPAFGIGTELPHVDPLWRREQRHLVGA